MTNELGPHSLSLDAALDEFIRIQSRSFESSVKPDLAGYKRCILKHGARANKIAVFWTIRDRHTGEPHHNVLKLATLSQTKKRGWEQTENSITLTDEDGDEISLLFHFMASEGLVEDHGDYAVVNLAELDERQFQRILGATLSSNRTASVLEEIANWIDSEPTATEGLIKLASDNPMRSKSLVAALNYGRYSRAIEDLRILVEANELEHAYQKFLEENFWMFGSEYSELIPNRNLLVNMQLDFPLRRTVDGYLDIIEIKRPMNDKPLFRQDKRGNWSEITEIVEARSQADNYIANIDAVQYQIWLKEHLDTEKVRAKVVIGRDGDEDQTRAMRRLNAQMHRIEFITYDQLLKIAQRILNILAEDNQNFQSDYDDNSSFSDIPF